MSLNPLCSSEIESYCRLRKINLSRWEIETICKVDDAYLQSRLDGPATVAAGASTLGQSVTGKKGRK